MIDNRTITTAGRAIVETATDKHIMEHDPSIFDGQCKTNKRGFSLTPLTIPLLQYRVLQSFDSLLNRRCSVEHYFSNFDTYHHLTL